MKNIANIIHFVRSVEPRSSDDAFLYDTLRQELELGDAFGFPCTVLLQYDALIRPDYQALVKAHPSAAPGLWLEVVQPQAQSAGVEWRGRWVWDWDVRTTFLSGYTPRERERLLDTAFGAFYGIFGRYPAAAGCWSIDAHSLAYMKERYGIKAFCVCKEQSGTDGITLWGGHYTGAYYPSETNALLPGSARQTQIGVPVFRMLGPDPVTQYDLGLGHPEEAQKVASLEPVYPYGGGDPAWVDWFIKENYNGKALALSYAQFGQENSFGWEEIGKGLPMQYQKLAGAVREGRVELQTLEQSGEWFSNTFETTPANACCTDSAPDGGDRRTAWYYSRSYRLNVLYENGRGWIRDLQLYSDRFPEPFLFEANTKTLCAQFALPVTDGFRFSDTAVRAGIYPVWDGDAPDAPFTSRTLPPDALEVAFGPVTLTAAPDALRVACGAPGFRLEFRAAVVPGLPYRGVKDNALRLSFPMGDGGFDYCLPLARGRWDTSGGGLRAMPDQTGTLEFSFSPRVGMEGA